MTRRSAGFGDRPENRFVINGTRLRVDQLDLDALFSQAATA